MGRPSRLFQVLLGFSPRGSNKQFFRVRGFGTKLGSTCPFTISESSYFSAAHARGLACFLLRRLPNPFFTNSPSESYPQYCACFRAFLRTLSSVARTAARMTCAISSGFPENFPLVLPPSPASGAVLLPPFWFL